MHRGNVCLILLVFFFQGLNIWANLCYFLEDFLMPILSTGNSGVHTYRCKL